ncbi:MAG: transposase [Thiotrichaceae bacterium]
MARQKTKSYSESFRKKAVRLADLPDKTAMDVSEDLGINVAQIYNWRNQFKRLSEKQFNTLDGVDYSKNESAEVRTLRKEVKQLKEERDFLKKATAYFAKDMK